MPKPAHLHAADVRGLSRIVTDATVGLTDLVEAMHHSIAPPPRAPGKPSTGRTKGITGFVYRTVRGVTHIVGAGVDALLGALVPLIAQKKSSQEREATLAALNGVIGDYLAASGNPLAIPMRLRTGGTPIELTNAALTIAYPKSGRRLLVLAHGLCMNDLQWNREGHDHGDALARELGYTPIYLHYNTGIRIAANGRAFADLMESLIDAWPHPVERLTLLCHSMGGLVARSAIHYGASNGHAWPERLDDLVFLGTPHFGAPMERAGTRVDFLLGISPYSAPFARLGRIRSAGIRDLGHGSLRDDDLPVAPEASSRARALPLALPRDVRCFAVAASKQKKPNTTGAKIRGDGLVPVDSALGRRRDASASLALLESRRWVGYGMGHFDLLSRAEVYERIRSWLAAAP